MFSRGEGTRQPGVTLGTAACFSEAGGTNWGSLAAESASESKLLCIAASAVRF